MFDKTSTHRLVGATLMLIAAAVVLPIVLDGERPPELYVEIELEPAPYIPPIAIAPLQSVDKLLADESELVANSLVDSTEELLDEPISELSEPLAPQNTITAMPQAMPKTVGAGAARWTVQIATFKSRDNAERLVKKLVDANYAAYSLTTNSLYKVYVGPELKREQAERFRDEIKKEFLLNGLVVRYAEN